MMASIFFMVVFLRCRNADTNNQAVACKQEYKFFFLTVKSRTLSAIF